MRILGLSHVASFLSFGLVFCCLGDCSAQDLKPMFNGKDFSGWVRTNTPDETWRYEDGMLVCSGKPIGEIRTERMYQNFIMELEWRHMVPRGNAGVFVWADDITSRGVPFHRGIEVQVLENAYGNNRSHTTHGDIFPIHGATMEPINGHGGSRAFPTENRSNPSPEWNHYRIECRDGGISLAVNGKVVTRGKNCVPCKGYICLESEGGVVHYRNVKIQELPARDIPEDKIAIPNRGYQSIYSGLDLRGWEPTSAPEQWKAKNWVLAFEGPLDESGSLSFAHNEPLQGFVVDIKRKHENSNAIVRAGDTLTIDLRDEIIQPHLEPSGRWNRIEVSKQNERLTLDVNGSEVSQTTLQWVSDKRLQLNANGSVDFANIYVR